MGGSLSLFCIGLFFYAPPGELLEFVFDSFGAGVGKKNGGRVRWRVFCTKTKKDSGGGASASIWAPSELEFAGVSFPNKVGNCIYTCA